MEHIWDDSMSAVFRRRLLEDERSRATIEKYTRDCGHSGNSRVRSPSPSSW